VGAAMVPQHRGDAIRRARTSQRALATTRVITVRVEGASTRVCTREQADRSTDMAI
jgi:hypothetical protein